MSTNGRFTVYEVVRLLWVRAGNEAVRRLGMDVTREVGGYLLREEWGYVVLPGTVEVYDREMQVWRVAFRLNTAIDVDFNSVSTFLESDSVFVCCGGKDCKEDR